MKIGELAKRTDTPVETIRFYEKEQLITPAARTENNYRHYSEKHVEELLFVRHCRVLDMTLDEVRTLLHLKQNPEQSCHLVDNLLIEHIGHVQSRIQALRALEEQLNKLRLACTHTQTVANCGVLNALACENCHGDAVKDDCHIACVHANIQTHHVKSK